jgi:hypothetical protein
MLVSLVRKQKLARALTSGLRYAGLVELGLGEDVMHLQAAHLAEHAGLERQTSAPVAGCAHAGEEVEHGVEAGAEAPAGEVPGFDAQPAMPEAQLLQQALQAGAFAFEGGEILVDERFGGAGEAAPHAGLHEPEQQPVALHLIHGAAALIEVAHHHRDAEAPEEHLVVIEAEAAGDQVEAGVDVSGGALEGVLDFGGALVVQVEELGLAGEHRVHRTQQPVEVEAVAVIAPFLELDLHRITTLRPVGADLGEGQVAFGELGAAAVDAVEDVHHHVERLVGAGDLFYVEIDLGDAEQLAETADELADPGSQLRVLAELGSQLAEAGAAHAEQVGDIDPERIVLHLHRLVEGKHFLSEMEAEPCESLSIAIKELGSLAAHHAIQGGHALLAIEQQLHHTSGQLAITAMGSGLRLCGPDQQATNGMALIKRIE